MCIYIYIYMIVYVICCPTVQEALLWQAKKLLAQRFIPCWCCVWPPVRAKQNSEPRRQIACKLVLIAALRFVETWERSVVLRSEGMHGACPGGIFMEHFDFIDSCAKLQEGYFSHWWRTDLLTVEIIYATTTLDDSDLFAQAVMKSQRTGGCQWKEKERPDMKGILRMFWGRIQKDKI